MGRASAVLPLSTFDAAYFIPSLGPTGMKSGAYVAALWRGGQRNKKGAGPLPPGIKTRVEGKGTRTTWKFLARLVERGSSGGPKESFKITCRRFGQTWDSPRFREDLRSGKRGKKSDRLIQNYLPTPATILNKKKKKDYLSKKRGDNKRRNFESSAAFPPD